MAIYRMIPIEAPLEMESHLMTNLLRRKAAKLIQLVGTVATLVMAAQQAQASVIYQAFNEDFGTITNKLADLSWLGVDFIQVSPPQKSIDETIWWGRYQPVDYRVIAGPLGDEASLKRLIDAAHGRGIKILVDAVLNHMADPVFHPGDLHYPQFGPQDFHYTSERPCIRDYSDRWQATKFWMCDPVIEGRRLPDLDTSSAYVRGVHKDYLRKLMALGVDGFRFDGVKHIEPEYFADVLQVIPRDKYYYGEVISDTPQLSGEYLPYMPLTDFQLLGVMIRAFSYGGSLQDLIFPEGIGAALPGSKAVVFSRNHDTVMASSFFNFSDLTDAKLANGFVLGRGVGKVLVYRDDISDAEVRAGMRFNHAMEGLPTNVRHIDEICSADQLGCNAGSLLVMDRGDRGVVIINKGQDWVNLPAARMPGLSEGCYQEMRLGFQMEVTRGGDAQKWVSMWGNRDRGGFQIGPRTVLYFQRVGGAWGRCAG